MGDVDLEVGEGRNGEMMVWEMKSIVRSIDFRSELDVLWLT